MGVSKVETLQEGRIEVRWTCLACGHIGKVNVVMGLGDERMLQRVGRACLNDHALQDLMCKGPVSFRFEQRIAGTVKEQ